MAKAKYIILSLAVLLLTFSRTHAQSSTTGKGARVILTYAPHFDNPKFHVYTPPFLAKAIYKDTVEAVNRFPEQLMSSVISTTTQEWINYNTAGGIQNAEKKHQKFFDFIRSMDKNKNYFELRAKLTFRKDNVEYAIVKFYMHTVEVSKPSSGAYVMIKQKDRWYLTSTEFTSPIAIMMMRFQEQKLASILKAQPSGDATTDDLVRKVTENGAINFDLLYHEFERWDSESQTHKIEFFLDKNAW